jgi:hypothetical protein
MSQIPIGWWKDRGLSEGLPLQQQVCLMIDGINQSPAQTYFYQKDIKLVKRIWLCSVSWHCFILFFWSKIDEQKGLFFGATCLSAISCTQISSFHRPIGKSGFTEPATGCPWIARRRCFVSQVGSENGAPKSNRWSLFGGLEHEFYWNPDSWDDDPIWLVIVH